MGGTRSIRRSAAPKGEDRHRIRRIRGATYFTSRQAFDDLTIVVRRFPGIADGRVFVLVHGIGVSSRYFTRTAAELSKFGRVYLVDLPGYGSAPDPRRDVSLADHAGVLAAFLEAADLPDPVVVGHSMGAQIVARLAIRHPEVVRQIVLMAPTMPPDARTFWRAVGRLLHDGLREPPIVNWIALTDYLLRTGPRYLLRQTPHLLQDRLEDDLPSVTAGTLVLGGHRDPIVPPAWAEATAALVPGGRCEIVHGAHVIMVTDPARVAEHIREHADR